MKRRITVGTTAIIVALATMGVTPVFASTNTETYTVNQGDTLFKIAEGKGVTLAAMEAANTQIANFADIFPGETINLPLTAYTVQPGDTFYKISVAEGIALSSVEAANPQITNYVDIYPGQTINIPAGTSTATPAPVPIPASATTSPSATTSTATSTTTSTAASATEASTTSVSVLRQNIVNYAETLLGKPYVWGGDTPSVGFDCSGLVEYVYAHFGITLPREAHDQATVGTPVAENALQPGDLLFLKDTDSYADLYANQVTHVGIYIGNGEMIESSSLNNRGVVIVRNVFSNPYYTSHYYGARNVIG